MITIGATRFNNTTYKENKDWREGNKWMGCIYPVPKRISKELRRNAMIVVLEMNNTTNAIMGIGCIKNRIRTETQYRIYGDRNYNRYVYHSKYRIDASEFSKELKECIGILEGICFKGKTHLKRGHGITCVSPRRLGRNRNKITNIFKNIYLKYVEREQKTSQV